MVIPGKPCTSVAICGLGLSAEYDTLIEFLRKSRTKRGPRPIPSHAHVAVEDTSNGANGQKNSGWAAAVVQDGLRGSGVGNPAKREPKEP